MLYRVQRTVEWDDDPDNDIVTDVQVGLTHAQAVAWIEEYELLRHDCDESVLRILPM